MNERIREIAVESQAYALVEFNGDSTKWSAFYNQKFAELIVQECVKVMYDNAIERNVPPDMNQTPTYYAVAVLEHFGLKTLDKML
tara:strand:+ start:479 stop:733 length:255 start_codon:yes stop_codon:yes gene_type:complete